ncbi:MAG: hypothetical protein ACK5G9_05695 [Akkermansiaceae bacterium]|jgi:hypothetical protein
MKHSSGYESHRELPSNELSLVLSQRPHSFSPANRRAPSQKIQALYPWLLLASTAIAAVFCYAYITKPVFVTYSSSPANLEPSKPISTPIEKPATKPETTSNNLPGLSPKKQTPTTKQELPPAPVTTGYEDTNIRMQHILDAQSASGDIHRIVIDIPALYKSRNLRWSQDDAAQARILLKRLEDYQEKSRTLRDEGSMILTDWNKLMDASVPNQVLRADSPSLSSNLLKASRVSQNPKQKAVKIQSDQESP